METPATFMLSHPRILDRTSRAVNCVCRAIAKSTAALHQEAEGWNGADCSHDKWWSPIRWLSAIASLTEVSLAIAGDTPSQGQRIPTAFLSPISPLGQACE